MEGILLSFDDDGYKIFLVQVNSFPEIKFPNIVRIFFIAFYLINDNESVSDNPSDQKFVEKTSKFMLYVLTWRLRNVKKVPALYI